MGGAYNGLKFSETLADYGFLLFDLMCPKTGWHKYFHQQWVVWGGWWKAVADQQQAPMGFVTAVKWQPNQNPKHWHTINWMKYNLQNQRNKVPKYEKYSLNNKRNVCCCDHWACGPVKWRPKQWHAIKYMKCNLQNLRNMVQEYEKYSSRNKRNKCMIK